MNENIIKDVCIKLRLTQKELASIFNISLPTIARYSSDNSKIPKLWMIAFKLTLENIELKEKLDNIKQAQEILKDI